MELISKEATIEAMCADCQGKCVPCEAWPCDDIKVIQNMPAIEPQVKLVAQINVDHDEIIERIKEEHKTGRWIEQEKGIHATWYKCSECGRVVWDDTGYDVRKDFPYCHCGARMEQ